MHGLVPYRDLLEQKGPVLYFVYGLAVLVSPHSFFSVYLLELIADTIALFVMSMCADLHRKNTFLLNVPLFSLILFPVQAFAWGGKVEELFLPFLAYALYLGFKVLNGQRLSPGQMLLIGLSVGIAFWSKFTFVGFYIGWLICVLGFSLKHGERQNLPKLLGALVLGFTLVTVPVLIYFGYHHAIRDLMKVYIYDNIFVYTGYERSGFSRLLTNYLYGLWMFLRGNAWLLPLITIGFLFDRTRMLLVPFVFLFCFSFIGRHSYPYYALIFIPLSCIGVASLTKLLHAGVSMKRLLVLEIMCLMVAVLPCLKDANKPKEAYPQVRFAEIIRQSEDPTLLNYGFLDGGFYMAADLLPSCKAFCKLNAPIPEMLQLQEDALQKGTCEFVVTNKPLADAPRYALAAECDGYYLYRRL